MLPLITTFTLSGPSYPGRPCALRPSLLPVLFGSYTDTLLEEVTQVVRLVVANGKCDIHNFFVGGGKHLFDFFDPDLREAFDKGLGHFLGEDGAEMGGAQCNVCCNAGEGDIGMIVVFLDVLACAMNELCMVAAVSAVPQFDGSETDCGREVGELFR